MDKNQPGPSGIKRRTAVTSIDSNRSTDEETESFLSESGSEDPTSEEETESENEETAEENVQDDDTWQNMCNGMIIIFVYYLTIIC